MTGDSTDKDTFSEPAIYSNIAGDMKSYTDLDDNSSAGTQDKYSDTATSTQQQYTGGLTGNLHDDAGTQDTFLSNEPSMTRPEANSFATDVEKQGLERTGYDQTGRNEEMETPSQVSRSTVGTKEGIHLGMYDDRQANPSATYNDNSNDQSRSTVGTSQGIHLGMYEDPQEKPSAIYSDESNKQSGSTVGTAQGIHMGMYSNTGESADSTQEDETTGTYEQDAESDRDEDDSNSSRRFENAEVDC